MQGVHLRFQWSGDGLPAAEAVVAALARELAAGVTLTAVVAGFGPLHKAATAGERAPVVVEWVDNLEHVAWVWPRLAPLVEGAIVSRQEVELVTPVPARLRRLRLDVAVETVMRPSPISVDAALPLTEVRRLLTASGVETAPVLDAAGAVTGVIRAAALPAEPDGATAVTAMDSLLVTAAPEARLRDVVALLLRHEVDEVPVVDERIPVGLVGLGDALRLVLGAGDALPAASGALRDALRARVPGL